MSGKDDGVTDGGESDGRVPGVERFIFVTVVVLVGLTLAGLFWWRLPVERVSFLVFGGGFLALAWLIGRWGLLGYSFERGFDPETGEDRPPSTTTVRATPLARNVLPPLLVLAGVAFLLAATSTRVGVILQGPARAAVMLAALASALWELAVAALFWSAVFWCIGSGVRQRDRGLALLGAVLAALGVGWPVLHYVVWPEHFRQLWDEFVEPFRYVGGWST